MERWRRRLIILNILVCSYEVFFFIAICGFMPRLNVHFGGGLGDLAYIFISLLILLAHVIAIVIMSRKVRHPIWFMIPLLPVCWILTIIHMKATEGNVSNGYRTSASNLIGLYIDDRKIIESEHRGDSIATGTQARPDSLSYELRGDYVLSIYPSQDNEICIVRLTGKQESRVVLQHSVRVWKYDSYTYNGYDFDDYFVLTRGGDHYLIRKNTGEIILKAAWILCDSSHNLVLYDKTTLLNLKNMEEVPIVEYMSGTLPENGDYTTTISEITDKEIVIFVTIHPDFLPNVKEIKVPRTKLNI